MNFTELPLHRDILKAIAEKGYEQPTPIQEQSIPIVVEGHDLIGVAQTGTGKTAAFSIPTIEILTRLNGATRTKKPKALILTPTRELAIQIQENIASYSKFLPNIRNLVIFGGVGQQPQVNALRKGVDILVATPGRLLDLIGQGHINLGELAFFVLDEADRMLDMGFIHDVKKVLKLLPKKRQNLLFSATMPENIVQLASSFMHNPRRVTIAPESSTAERVEQAVYYVDKPNKRKLLLHLLKKEIEGQVLVFSRTKHGANRIARDLGKHRISAAAIHGNKGQTARQKALGEFKSGKLRVLVATDIAARGIDVEELPQVIQFDLPNVPETYVHRIGRTGRAGAEGRAIAFCDDAEKQQLRAIYRLTRQKPAVVADHPFELDGDDNDPLRPFNDKKRRSEEDQKTSKKSTSPKGRHGKSKRWKPRSKRKGTGTSSSRDSKPRRGNSSRS